MDGKQHYHRDCFFCDNRDDADATLAVAFDGVTTGGARGFVGHGFVAVVVPHHQWRC